jgi:hypothetical protein
MKRTIQFAVLAAVAAGGVATLGGCQNAGRRDGTDRAVTASAVTYDRAYVATRDTEWVSAPGAATRNTLPRGTRVYFADGTPTAEWQQARIEGQGVVYVRPGDFARDSR